MKRVGNIFEKIVDIENIMKAIDMASQGKREQKLIKDVLDNKLMYAEAIRDMLIDKSYRPLKPVEMLLRDTRQRKDRIIYKPHFFPDQIIHWALMMAIQSIIYRGMYQYSVGSIPKRGMRKGQVAIQKWITQKDTKYCLKMDVTKFYPSIDNEILKSKFRKIIKDKETLWLIDSIIDSNKGQPIGYYTSQWFANFYLQDLDHFIKEKLGAKYYVRYVDDLVILGPNKRKLHKMQKEVDAFLKKEKLQMKGNWQIFPIAYFGEKKGRPIDFLGLKFYKNATTLRRRNSLRWGRRMRRILKHGYMRRTDACAFISYKGFMKRTNSYHYYKKYFQPVVSPGIAKRLISKNEQAKNKQENGFIFDLSERRYKRIGGNKYVRNANRRPIDHEPKKVSGL